MLEDSASLRGPGSVPDPALLDAEWRRCRHEARSLMLLELALTILAVGVLASVALCGVVAIAHAAVVSGDVALPLGLALAVTIALTLLGLAARARMSHELLRRDLFALECARRTVADRAKAGHPYRAPAPSEPTCTYCLFHERVRRARPT